MANYRISKYKWNQSANNEIELWGGTSTTPEAVITAPIGSLFLNTTTGTLWIKKVGTDNLGWTRMDSATSATLALGSTTGSLVLNSDPEIRLASVALSSGALDANTIPASSGMVPYSVSSGTTNYPVNTGGTGVKFMRSGGVANGMFEIFAPVVNSGRLYYRVGTGAASFSNWELFAPQSSVPVVGTFTVTGTGQTSFTIPHGLGSTPTYSNVNAKSAAARTAGITSWVDGAAGLVVTVTTPNTGGTLTYVWEAKL